MTDCSSWEQLGILLRYVKDSVAVEKLIEYVQCHNVEGKTIAKLIIDTVTNVGLNTSLCRSQTYDGAENMSGKQKGASNQFCEITGNKKAVYFHCASHELNLCLSKASKVLQIHNMVRTMQSVCLSFKFSAKHQRILETSIAQMHSDNEETKQKVKLKVKPLCETRWVERQTAFDDLISLYEAVTFCLGKIE